MHEFDTDVGRHPEDQRFSDKQVDGVQEFPQQPDGLADEFGASAHQDDRQLRGARFTEIHGEIKPSLLLFALGHVLVFRADHPGFEGADPDIERDGFSAGPVEEETTEQPERAAHEKVHVREDDGEQFGRSDENEGGCQSEHRSRQKCFDRLVHGLDSRDHSD